MKKAIVLIDGQNLFYSFKNLGILEKDIRWNIFLNSLVVPTEFELLRTYWFRPQRLEGKIKQLENIVKSLKDENNKLRSGDVYVSLRETINQRNKKIAELHQTVNGLIQKLHFPKVA